MATNKEKLRWLANEAKRNGKAFIAMNPDGLWYGYEKRPELWSGQWCKGGTWICLAPIPDKDFDEASSSVFEVEKILYDNR